MDPTGTENYYFEKPGDMFIRPLDVKVRGSFSSGALSISATRRQSHQATPGGSAGSYTLSGLPRGRDYHIKGLQLVAAGATASVFVGNVVAFDAEAGTLSFITRQIAYDGSQAGAAVASSAAAAPADNTQLHLSLEVETGVYS